MQPVADVEKHYVDAHDGRSLLDCQYDASLTSKHAVCGAPTLCPRDGLQIVNVSLDGCQPRSELLWIVQAELLTIV